MATHPLALLVVEARRPLLRSERVKDLLSCYLVDHIMQACLDRQAWLLWKQWKHSDCRYDIDGLCSRGLVECISQTDVQAGA